MNKTTLHCSGNGLSVSGGDGREGTQEEISAILEMFLETQAMKPSDAGFDFHPATDWLCELCKSFDSFGLQFSHPHEGLLEGPRWKG